MSEPEKGYFEKYTNLHRLASEELIAAVKFQQKKGLDEAEKYAQQAMGLASTYFEVVLSQGILHTISLERIAFEAMEEFNIIPRESNSD